MYARLKQVFGVAKKQRALYKELVKEKKAADKKYDPDTKTEQEELWKKVKSQSKKQGIKKNVFYMLVPFCTFDL